MNDAELERELTRALHDLFPEPAEASLAVPNRRRGGWPVAVVGAVAVVAAVGAGIGIYHATSPTRHAVATESTHAGKQPSDLGVLARRVPCPPPVNVTAVSREGLRSFPAIAAVTCAWDTRIYPHAGEWSVMVRKASDTGVAALVAAFDQQDQPATTGACTGVLISGPPLMLVDAAGKYILARYPRDACDQPLAAAIAAMRQHTWQTISVRKEKLIRSARSIATGCGDEAKDLLYDEPGTPLSPGEPVLNRHPKLTLKACIYRRTSSSSDIGRFVRIVTFDANQSAQLRDALSGAGPTHACTPQRTFAVISTPVWDKVGDADNAWLEVGGCWRVYFDEWPAHNGQWRSLIGTADPSVVRELLGLR